MSVLDGASRAAAVTPNDVTVIGAKALYIGVSGAVAVVLKEGDAPVTFTAVPVGFFPVAALRVMATGTTATNIVALY